MATKVEWSPTIHPTLTTFAMPPCANSKELIVPEETSAYDKAKETYEEAKEAYQIALEDLTNAQAEAEKARQAMVKAREAFLLALGNDKIEEES